MRERGRGCEGLIRGHVSTLSPFLAFKKHACCGNTVVVLKMPDVRVFATHVQQHSSRSADPQRRQADRCRSVMRLLGRTYYVHT